MELLETEVEHAPSDGTEVAVRGGKIMKRLASLGVVLALGCAALAAQETPAKSLTLAAGTKVELAVTAPVWMKTAKAGDPLYLQTIFPVIASGAVAIPAGSYVQGTLLNIKRPSRFNGRGEVDVRFTAIIYASGYAVILPEAPTDAATNGMPATAAKLTVLVSAASDVLLDNGTQLEMTLATPLDLDATQVTEAQTKARAIVPGTLRSATRCRPTSGTPGTPGTSDTVIPGTPGTPSTTIQGGPGMPDITIPGTPATPDTVIHGSPGTPGFAGTSCPAPPMVTASEPLALPLASVPSAAAKR